MHTPRTLKTATASLLAAGTLSVAIGLPAASAAAPVSEQYAARAGAQVAELSLLGRGAVFGSALTDSALEAVGRQLSATATGTGTDLSPGSRSVARFGDDAARGGDACADAPLGPALTRARPALAAGQGRTLPTLTVAPACGASKVTGTADTFTAESTGGATRLKVQLPEAMKALVGQATAALSPAALSTPVGDLVKQAAATTGTGSTAGGATQSAAPAAGRALGTLNGVLGKIAPGVAAPVMEPRQTVGAMLQRLGSSDLVHIDLATATARNGADPKAFLAEALAEGGVIDVLPGFRGAGSAPLLRLTITRSHVAVPVDRASLQAAPVVDNAVVRVESDLLGSLPVAGPPVVNGLVHGVPLAGLPGATLPIAGGFLGGNLPLDQLVAGLGLRSGQGFVEVGPGQSLSVLCDGAVAPLCSEISVGAAKAPVTLPSGATHAESSTVTVHLFKALDNLAPGTSLGTVLAQPAVTRALQAAAPAPLGIGNPTGIPGIRLVTGGVVAEAGGTRVLGAETVAAPVAPPAAPATQAPARDLPHTGGTPFGPATAPLLLGAGGALATLLRRTRRSA